MEAPDFWDNAEVSQMKMKQLKSLKDDIETYHNLETQMEDMETMIEMGYEENDPEIIPEIQEMLDEFQASFDSIRVKTLLSGEYDSENAIIKLNAGAGGTEACDWCGAVSEAIGERHLLGEGVLQCGVGEAADGHCPTAQPDLGRDRSRGDRELVEQRRSVGCASRDEGLLSAREDGGIGGRGAGRREDGTRHEYGDARERRTASDEAAQL